MKSKDWLRTWMWRSSKTTTRSMSERRPMATTVRPRANGTSDRVSDRGRARDQQYDLLTAAVLGAMIGAGAALLLRRGPTGRRPLTPIARAAGGAAITAARLAGKGGRRGARWAA